MSDQCSEMSPAQIEEFLQVPRFATVGTIRKNGTPQLTPVWYLYEGGKLYITMYVNSVKYRNLSRDPRIALCIAGNHPDARAVMIYGTVELVLEESPWVDDIVWRLTRRYHDSDEEARTYMESPAGEGDSVLVVVTPGRMLAEDYN